MGERVRVWAWVKEGSRVAELKDVVRNLIWPWAEMPMVARGRISRCVRDLLWMRRPWMIRGRVLVSVVGGRGDGAAEYAGGEVVVDMSLLVLLDERNKEKDGQRIVLVWDAFGA